MARQAEVIEIVIGSPADVEPERKALDRVIEELNQTFIDEYGVILRVRKWEIDCYPAFECGGPQALIDSVLQIRECDIFIGIFWTRFGTPVHDGRSGTEHEFKQAYDGWRLRGRPQILFYFKDKPYSPKSANELAQWQDVVKFKEHFPPEGFWWAFKKTSDFERFLRKHIKTHVNILRKSRSTSDESEPGTDQESVPGLERIPEAAWWEKQQAELETKVGITGPITLTGERSEESLSLLVRIRGGPTGDAGLPVVGFQCVTTNMTELNDIQADAQPILRIRLSEAYAGAFQARGRRAAQSTRFVLRFAGVPHGVRLAVPGLVKNGADMAICLILEADPAGAGGTMTTTSALHELHVSGGRATAVFEVILNNPTRANQLEVGVVAAWRANTSHDLPARGVMQADVKLTPAGDYIAGRHVLAIARCSTILLFPFVTNQAGFDTSIAICNTTSDPVGTCAQSGPCHLYYYGSTSDGGAAPVPQMTAIVHSGSHVVFTLSGGNFAARVTGTPGFQGYIIAICEFQHAWGFAHITDGFGGVPSIASGYLAQIIGAFPGGRRSGEP